MTGWDYFVRFQGSCIVITVPNWTDCNDSQVYIFSFKPASKLILKVEIVISHHAVERIIWNCICNNLYKLIIIDHHNLNMRQFQYYDFAVNTISSWSEFLENTEGESIVFCFTKWQEKSHKYSSMSSYTISLKGATQMAGVLFNHMHLFIVLWIPSSSNVHLSTDY